MAEIRESYQQNQLVTKVRDKENITELYTESLSGNKIPRVSVPKFEDPGGNFTLASKGKSSWLFSIYGRSISI